MRPAAEIEASGYRLIALDSTSSTNDEAAAAARQGDLGRLWIVADEQRAGRGRHGRTWISPRGNLYASLLLIDPCEPAVAAQLGFVAGVALHEAVAAQTGLGGPRLALKWPNDLLLDGAKIAGLLLEGHSGRAGSFALVIGFGVNIVDAPDDTAYPAKALQAVRSDVTAEGLLSALACSFASHFDAWREARADGAGDPFNAIRQRWLARAAGIGQTVTVRLSAGERRGAFMGLDAAGRLQLRTPAGTELIDAGDLYFPASLAADAQTVSPISR